MKTPQGKAADSAVLGLGYGGSDNDSITLDALADVATLAKRIDLAITFQVAVLRNRGESWEKVGTALGISRQAAQKRFAHPRMAT